jgi:hypothetical protein
MGSLFVNHMLTSETMSTSTHTTVEISNIQTIQESAFSIASAAPPVPAHRKQTISGRLGMHWPARGVRSIEPSRSLRTIHVPFFAGVFTA